MSWSQLRTLFIAAMVMISVCMHPRVGNTYAVFEARHATTTNSFVGAAFSPSVAPTITARDTGNAILLTWPVVTISSGATINYDVMRYSNGVGVAVCTAPGATTLVTTTSTMQCRDDAALTLTTYIYTEQPYVFAGGVRTWSLAPSVDSSPACVKRCR